MQEVGAYEVKSHLAELVDKVATGESFVITRRGHPVAMLTPPLGRALTPTEEVIDRIRESRRGVRLEGLSLKSLIEEGRR